MTMEVHGCCGWTKRILEVMELKGWSIGWVVYSWFSILAARNQRSFQRLSINAQALPQTS